MSEEEIKDIIDNMSEEEFNDFIFFSLQEMTKKYENLVKKIRDKVEEINKAYEDSKDEYGETEYYYPNYTVQVLEELLENEERGTKMSEEEAITKLKSIVKVHNDFLENCEKETISKDEIEAIETVLSILEDKKQKIRRLYKESNQVFNENEKLKEKLEETKSNEYECNNIIKDLLDEIKKRNKTIDLIAEQLIGLSIVDDDVENPIIFGNKEEVIKYFKEQVENEEMEL